MAFRTPLMAFADKKTEKITPDTLYRRGTLTRRVVCSSDGPSNHPKEDIEEEDSSESSDDSNSSSTPFVWPVLINRCVECGTDMGDGNPRQLCGKWQCENTYVEDASA